MSNFLPCHFDCIGGSWACTLLVYVNNLSIFPWWYLQANHKEREQTVRKYEQEVDSLSFRNQQLSTRCSLLQDDFEALESKKKHKVHFLW